MNTINIETQLNAIKYQLERANELKEAEIVFVSMSLLLDAVSEATKNNTQDKLHVLENNILDTFKKFNLDTDLL